MQKKINLFLSCYIVPGRTNKILFCTCGLWNVFCGQLTVWTTRFFFLSEICYVQNDVQVLVEFREDFMEVNG